MKNLRVGIDLGGTKTELVALGPDGETLDSRRWATPQGDYQATIDMLVAQVADAEAVIGAAGSVGIGIPGTLSPATGLVKNANSTWLNGRPLNQDLAEALGRPVRIANDANCFALSEATDGAGAGHKVVFGVIMGTGVGAGIVVHGTPLIGPNAIAGEWGHTALPVRADRADGPPRVCWCGRTDCIETYLSGPGLSETYRLISGEAVPAKNLPERAVAGDMAAICALDLHADQCAIGLAQIVNILDPDIVVLGGGVSNLPEFAGRIEARWSRFIFSDRVDTLIRRHRHGDASGVRGAAWLWNPTP